MIKDRFDAISAAHRESARSALIAAVGAAPISAITPVSIARLVKTASRPIIVAK
jgi:hypothetical protein